MQDTYCSLDLYFLSLPLILNHTCLQFYFTLPVLVMMWNADHFISNLSQNLLGSQQHRQMSFTCYLLDNEPLTNM